ncbi:choice-of-anchor Q domain-containing protein [Desulfonatronum sp. SC1]|uniref:InlB B-repeat-containing protein n=1 Tax=Desulfonatronum sp. SC1 TaxID=2109626 RepID=UPI000D2F6371|nr:choice-of-anchor Q domain-containing protein [Desulfonatronum sp. SC1]PTN33568.1 hypothetical protein C6366_14080 [Desulfonatronum sp. SC1]
MKKYLFLVTTALLFLALSTAAMAQITIVPAEGDRTEGSYPEAVPDMPTFSPRSGPPATLTVGNGCTYATIASAIAAANPGDTLMLEGTRTFTENITILKDLTLQGGYSGCVSGSSARTTIKADDAKSVVDIRNSAVTLRNLHITGGNAIGGGVDIDSGSALSSQATLDNVRIAGNTGSWGAGLYVGSRSIVTLINGTRIEYNTATFGGGGARVWGRLVVNSVSGGITHNTAPNGGGVSVPGGVLEMRPGHVGNNQATAAEGRGGGIHVLDGGEIILTHSSNVYQNSASLGGGIFAENSKVTLNNSQVLYNTATFNGGGINLSEPSVLDVLNHSVIAGNHALGNAGLNGNGGGIMAYGTNTINISDTRLRENIAGDFGKGGAIHQNNGTLTIAYSYLHHNSAYYGGAIYQTGVSASANVSNCLIHHNTVIHPLGAGIRRQNGDFTISHTTLADNVGGAGFSGVATSATNSIAWGNGGNLGFVSSPVHASCNIDNSGNAGANSDPLFVSPGAGQDYHLQAGSPAIDACSSGLSSDLDNLPRPIGSRYDMGPYELYYEHTVGAGIAPPGGGTVTGTGSHMAGSTVTLNASANPGYVFVNWTEGNQVVSCSASYSFRLMSDRTLRANFSQVQSQYTITGAASPANYGSVAGSGPYNNGAYVTMTAQPNQGFALSNWIETWPGLTGHCVVSTDEQYSFTAIRNRNLTANVRPKTLPGVLMLLLDE